MPLFEQSDDPDFPAPTPLFCELAELQPCNDRIFNLKAPRLGWIHLNVTCDLVKEELLLGARETGDLGLLWLGDGLEDCIPDLLSPCLSPCLQGVEPPSAWELFKAAGRNHFRRL